MGEGDGLGALEVGVAGDEDSGVLFAERDERALEAGDVAEQRGDFIAQPEPQVEGHLVIAGAGRVQFCAGGNPPGQLGLDVHVDVFQRRLPSEFARADFPADLVQPARDGIFFGPREHADFVEHGGVGERALNVMPPQAPVEGDGFGELRDLGGGSAGEASAAGHGGFSLHKPASFNAKRQGRKGISVPPLAACHWGWWIIKSRTSKKPYCCRCGTVECSRRCHE